MKSRDVKSQRREEKKKRRRKKIKKRKTQKKEDPGARKGRKVAKHCVFPMICGSGGSKSRLAKAADAEPAGQMRDEKLRRCGAKHISKSKCTKHTKSGPLLEVEMSKKCTPLWRETHLQVKKLKTPLKFGALFKVEMSKKCTQLWREARFEVKMYKPHHSQTTFGNWDVEKVQAVVARSTFRSQNVKNARGSEHFWTSRCRFAWQARCSDVKSEQNVRVL